MRLFSPRSRVHEFDTVLLRWRPADASLYLPVASEAVLMAIGGEMFAALKNENRCARAQFPEKKQEHTLFKDLWH